MTTLSELGRPRCRTRPRVTSSGGCNYAVNPGVDALIGDDAVFVYIDRDGDPATGDALDHGADIVVGTLGEIGPESPPLLGVWNGAQFTFTDPAPVGGAVGVGGFSATLDRLGIPAGVTTGITVATIYEGLYSNYIDVAPDLGAASAIPLAVAYSTTPPPPPPAPAPQPIAAPAPAPAAAPVADQGCVVPSVKRRTRDAAELRLFDADCAIASSALRVYSSVPKGRVIRTIPASGVRTTRSVRLVLSKGPRRRHARAHSSAASRSALAELTVLANAPRG